MRDGKRRTGREGGGKGERESGVGREGEEEGMEKREKGRGR